MELIIAEMQEIGQQMKALDAEIDRAGITSGGNEQYFRQWRYLRDGLIDDLKGIGGIRILLHLLDNYTPPPGDGQAG